MRLEHLCDMELVAPAARLSSPAGGEAMGAGVGGTASGAYLDGIVQWVQPPAWAGEAQERAGWEMLLTTQEGSRLRCVLQEHPMDGTSDLGAPDQVLFLVRFAGEAGRYQWLTHALCLAEGLHSPTTGRLQLRLYTCVHELSHLGHHLEDEGDTST